MGLINAQQAAPSDKGTVMGHELGADPSVVRALVKSVYGDHFEQVKKALVSSDKNSIQVMVPSIVNMAIMAYEKQHGQPIGVEMALKAMLQVVLMLLSDTVRSIIKRPFSEDELHTVLRNALVMYLKGHQEIIPPEILKPLEQMGTMFSMSRGRAPNSDPSGLLTGGTEDGENPQLAEGTPAEESDPAELAQNETPAAEQTEQTQGEPMTEEKR